MGMTNWPAPSHEQPRGVTILGSTGSVGQSTVDLIARDPGSYRVEALVAGNSVEALAEQARRLRARLAVVANPQRYRALKDALAGTVDRGRGRAGGGRRGGRAAGRVGDGGDRGLRRPRADPGCARGAAPWWRWPTRRPGLRRPAADATRSSGRAASCCRSIPSTTPSSRCSSRSHRHAIDRLILTASGGPFRNWSLADMAEATPEQALAHPNWDMGAKISIDSATMMNKGLELIEAHLLFGLPAEQIEIVVHPQSVIHSHGRLSRRLGAGAARHARHARADRHALGWPSRIDGPAERLDFANLSPLTFERPDSGRFPGATSGARGSGAGRIGTDRAECGQRGGGRGVPGAPHRLPRHRPRRRGCAGGERHDCRSGWNPLQQVQAADREARRRAEEAVQSRSLSN